MNARRPFVALVATTFTLLACAAGSEGDDSDVRGTVDLGTPADAGRQSGDSGSSTTPDGVTQDGAAARDGATPGDDAAAEAPDAGFGQPPDARLPDAAVPEASTPDAAADTGAADTGTTSTGPSTGRCGAGPNASNYQDEWEIAFESNRASDDCGPMSPPCSQGRCCYVSSGIGECVDP